MDGYLSHVLMCLCMRNKLPSFRGLGERLILFISASPRTDENQGQSFIYFCEKTRGFISWQNMMSRDPKLHSTEKTAMNSDI